MNVQLAMTVILSAGLAPTPSDHLAVFASLVTKVMVETVQVCR